MSRPKKISADSRFKALPEVVSRTVQDEQVLLNLESGIYFGLNPVGARIWSLIESGKAVNEITRQLCEEYEVSPAKAESDLLALVQQLAKAKLVQLN